jgi:carboxyl-terminal processing protease
VRIARAVIVCAAKGILLFAAPAVFGDEATNATQILSPNPTAFDTLSRFVSVLEVLRKHYIQPAAINDPAYATAALREYVRSLDSSADLLTADELAAATRPEPYAGADIGISLVIRNDYPAVVAPLDGGPAQRAGLFPGDEIIALDGQPLAHARLRDAVERLRGDIGSRLTLHVLDPVTHETRDVSLKRATPAPHMDDPIFLSRSIVYFRLPEFSADVVERLRPEILQPKVRQATGLILDLRNNPGGAFDAMRDAASLFLPARSEIVTVEYANPALRATFASESGNKFTAPVILLVNGGTAGEAEIFAAALRDHKRARLVGTTTFGCGRLISLYPLPDGSALSLPTADYLPPSKQSFNNTGLTPDVAAELPRRIERSLAAAGFGSFNRAHGRDRIITIDLPLARAVELLAK